ncbi:hypothetical protein Glove_21g199 [Diversispora epigaea]|uniref:Uncharacterized protein n=1 Tax=Diversispora epigaea TaxID=1348612 RepID=A0A397JWK2_9GLOM|nr:hypothetical protein Glove_21g199 [Diversispora epigaea]
MEGNIIKNWVDKRVKILGGSQLYPVIIRIGGQRKKLHFEAKDRSIIININNGNLFNNKSNLVVNTLSTNVTSNEQKNKSKESYDDTGEFYEMRIMLMKKQLLFLIKVMTQKCNNITLVNNPKVRLINEL